MAKTSYLQSLSKKTRLVISELLAPDREIADASLFRRKFAQALASVTAQKGIGRALSEWTTLLNDNITVSSIHKCEIQGLFSDYRLALVAVGGYGGKTMGLKSDVDFLIVAPNSDIPADLIASKIALLQNELRKVGIAWNLAFDFADVQLERPVDDDTCQMCTTRITSRFVFGDEACFDRYLENTNRSLKRYTEPLLTYFDRLRDMRYDTHKKGTLADRNLKDAPGGFRDLDTFHWIKKLLALHGREREIYNAITFDADTPEEEIDAIEVFKTASDFIRRTKCALHILCPGEVPIGSAKVNEIDINKNAELLAELLYGEKGKGEDFASELIRQGKVLSRIMRNLQDTVNSPYEYRLKQIEKKKSRGKDKSVAEQSLLLVRDFQYRLQNDPIDYSFQRRLRAQVNGIKDNSVFRKEEQRVLFREILNETGEVGDALRLMNDTGILTRVYPPFKKIVNFVEQGVHATFNTLTIDNHILAMTQELDFILFVIGKPDVKQRFERSLEEYQRAVDDIRNTSDVPLFISRANSFVKRIDVKNVERWANHGHLTSIADRISAIQRPEILYAAALLHDIAKPIEKYPGEHATIGANMAQSFSKKFNFSERDARRMALLVELHTVMPSSSQNERASDPALIESLAVLIPDKEFLTMLYLLSYTDMCTANPEKWTKSKGRWLRILYDKTYEYIDNDRSHIYVRDQLKHIVFHEARKRNAYLPEEKTLTASEIEKHFSLVSDSYLSQMSDSPSLVVDQLFMINRLLKEKQTCLVSPVLESDGISKFIVVSRDKPGLFAELCGVIAVKKSNISEANIFTRDDGIACNVFLLEAPLPAYSEQDRLVQSFVGDMQLAVEGSYDVHSRINLEGSSVEVSDEDSEIQLKLRDTRIVNVKLVSVPNQMGLAYLIGKLFAENLFSVHHAKLRTGKFSSNVVFEIGDRDGGEIDTGRIDQLKKLLDNTIHPK